MRRGLVLSVAFAISAMLAGCAGSHGASKAVEAKTAQRAIAHVQVSSLGSEFAACPKTTESRSFVIHGGGPPPGLSVKGTCESSVSIPSHGRFRTVVTFTEYWPWQSFHYSDTPPGRLHHWWRFGVLTNGHVTEIGEGGNFPPQSVV